MNGSWSRTLILCPNWKLSNSEILAHPSADLAICRNPRYRLGKPCLDEYQQLVPVSEPRADFDGRNAVYAMKYHVLLGIIHSDDESFSQVLIDELKALLETADMEGV